MTQCVRNPTSIHEDVGSISLALLSGLRIQQCMSYGIGHRHISDPTLLWPQCRLAAAAPIQPLVWQLPYASSVALKRRKKTHTPAATQATAVTMARSFTHCARKELLKGSFHNNKKFNYSRRHKNLKCICSL